MRVTTLVVVTAVAIVPVGVQAQDDPAQQAQQAASIVQQQQQIVQQQQQQQILQQQQLIQQQQQDMQFQQNQVHWKDWRQQDARLFVDAPTFWPPPDQYPDSIGVTLSDPVPGAMIFYTVDGSFPTTASPRYSGPITIAATSTVNAIAVAPWGTKSTLLSGTFEITHAADSARTRPPNR
jgi:hypothetical protein